MWCGARHDINSDKSWRWTRWRRVASISLKRQLTAAEKGTVLIWQQQDDWLTEVVPKCGEKCECVCAWGKLNFGIYWNFKVSSQVELSLKAPPQWEISTVLYCEFTAATLYNMDLINLGTTSTFMYEDCTMITPNEHCMLTCHRFGTRFGYHRVGDLSSWTAQSAWPLDMQNYLLLYFTQFLWFGFHSWIISVTKCIWETRPWSVFVLGFCTNCKSTDIRYQALKSSRCADMLWSIKQRSYLMLQLVPFEH